eukprot:4766728-Lingulodinium_polyedra.AAC.1
MPRIVPNRRVATGFGKFVRRPCCPRLHSPVCQNTGFFGAQLRAQFELDQEIKKNLARMFG